MPRRRRTLRPEERDLWRKVADTADPLHPERPDPAPPEATPPAPLPAREQQKPRGPGAPVPAFRLGERSRRAAPGHDMAPGISDRLAREPLQMDRKNFTRMKRGKLPVEGRIDLHGMTLSEAHPRLVDFILMSHAAGRRLVLVITGKGKSRRDDGPIPTRRGLLKHQVPQWLNGPALRAAVLQVSEAHQSHGGTGAYYVYLRRRR